MGTEIGSYLIEMGAILLFSIDIFNLKTTQLI